MVDDQGGRRRLGRLLCVASAVLACLAPVGPARSQDKDPTPYFGLLGATPPDPRLGEGLPRATLTRAYLPEAIDLSGLMPPPVQQELGSCVAHAAGYAARGYYAALEQKTRPGDPEHTPSPAYLHSQIAGSGTSGLSKPTPELCKTRGSSAAAALRYMIDHGLPTNAKVPIADICTPAVTATDLAKNEYSINDGLIIFLQKTPDDRPGQAEVDKIKQSLAAGDPVVFGARLVRLFPDGHPDADKAATLMVLEAGEIYHGSAGPNQGELDGGHEMVFVGYDDRRQAFLIQNSWGGGWADKGFGWFGYDAVKADVDEAMVLQTGFTPPRPRPADGSRPNPNVAEGECAAVSLAADGGTYEGFVESEAELAKLRGQFGAAAVSKVAVRPWPVCETLLTLDRPLLAPSRPRITLKSGGDQKKFGDVLDFSVTTPDFPSFLYVAYLQADGTVVNLVPRRGPLRKQLAPGTVLTFGDGKEGRQTFRAAAPAGTEAVVAIAARSPLLQLEALEAEGNGQFHLAAASKESGKDADDRLYLSLLRAALVDTPDPQMAGRDVTADVLHLTISGK